MSRAISSAAARRRAATLAALRRGLDERGFVEVTTPVVLRVNAHGPAPMQAFSLSGDTYDLRTSIELLLRTALTAAPRVYDIGPAIRFEDSSKQGRSAVEFTLLEFFASDVTYVELIDLVGELLRESVNNLPATPQRISVVDWFSESWGISFDTTDPVIVRSKLANIVGADLDVPLWKLIDVVVSSHLEPLLNGLVFLTDYPIETICLAKRSASASHVAERFEVYLNGLEIGHGFIDATDAEDVLARMIENGQQFVDQGFVDLLRSGDLPPSGGFGLGVERLLTAADGADADICLYLHEYQHG